MIAGAVTCKRIVVRGTVQGVGFRPFVYRLAARHGLAGWVRNRSGDVEIEVEGPADAIAAFLRDLRAEPPPLAQVEAVGVTDARPTGSTAFEIRGSQAAPGEARAVPPDTAPCGACLRELDDPRDRRYRYPFVNCTDCGPRFTIVEALPYDRPNTTMRGFPLCAACAREYHDPADHRYHAQPIACPACGPRLWLEHDGRAVPGDPLAETVALLRAGRIVALKGLGGFHLACDARDEAAVARLRARKRRGAKPFAVMFPDLASIAAVYAVSPAEAALLQSPRRPIVLVAQPSAVSHQLSALSSQPSALCPEPSRVPSTHSALSGRFANRPYSTQPSAHLPPDSSLSTHHSSLAPRPAHSALSTQHSPLAPSVAPGLAEIGVMLPSTPMHYLLLRDFGGPLVMTSGNLAEEPIAADNDEARARLAPLADAFLLHDRPIASRYDDSVARVQDGAPLLVRRARGYAPAPLALPFAARRPVLAVGAQLKSAFCLLQDDQAFLSQHVGDLENVETLAHYRATLALYQRLFAGRPALVAHDLHPEYLSTKLALHLDGVERVGVQHHHAHVVSCLVEHGQAGPAIGVAYDGLGYGTDGHLWGGEIIVADWLGFERRAHLREAPLPGGEASIRKPYRMALGYLAAWFPGDLDHFAPFLERLDAREVGVVRKQVERGLNAPLTSSCGRLFDAVAALLGVCPLARYEGQAAMELQALADPTAAGRYPWDLLDQDDRWIVDPAPLLWAAYADHRAGVPPPTIAMRFHRTLADLTAALVRRLAAESGLRRVALSGGVFQNALLLREVLTRLRAAELEVYFHRRVPTNDGGLALGQAVIAHSVREAADHG